MALKIPLILLLRFVTLISNLPSMLAKFLRFFAVSWSPVFLWIALLRCGGKSVHRCLDVEFCLHWLILIWSHFQDIVCSLKVLDILPEKLWDLFIKLFDLLFKAVLFLCIFEMIFFKNLQSSFKPEICMLEQYHERFSGHWRQTPPLLHPPCCWRRVSPGSSRA